MPSLSVQRNTKKLQSIPPNRIALYRSRTGAVDVQELLRLSLSLYSQTSQTKPLSSSLPTPPSSPPANEAPDSQPASNRHLPAFVLEPSYRKDKTVQFSTEWPPASYDILDRHRFLHLAYGPVSLDTLAVVLVDDSAEAWKLSYETVDVTSPADVVKCIWECAEKRASQASIEWRIVVTCFISSSTEGELEGMSVNCFKATTQTLAGRMG